MIVKVDVRLPIGVTFLYIALRKTALQGVIVMRVLVGMKLGFLGLVVLDPRLLHGFD